MEYKIGEDFAKKLDKEDPLARYKKRFYIPERETLDMDGRTKSVKPIIYMDGNSLGLASKNVEEEMKDEFKRWKNLTTRRSGVDKKAAEYQAKLVGAETGEVIVTGGASVNLHALVSTFYKPKGKRTKIIGDELNFSSDIYALAGQIRLKGMDPEKNLIIVKSRDGRTISEEDIIAVMSDEVSICHLPSVYFVSGQLLDMKLLTKAAHDNGVIIGYDCCHSVGVIPHKLHEWGVDYAFWCNYKYMNGSTGAIAGLYIHRKHFNKTPGLPTWCGNSPSNRFDFKAEWTPTGNAASWHLGSNLSIGFGVSPVFASSKMILDAGLERIREKSLKATGYMMYLIDELLSKKPYNYSVGNPREPERRGGHVAVEHDEARRISEALTARGVLPDFRPPRTIRLSPIPLYTTYQEVWEVVQHLKVVIDNKEYQKYDLNKKEVY
ncbi:MAG: kynureninase [Candidatus Bathyarchaeota archaeon]|nr:kynureninase [Candidatus Bathyarchaeota archaeon]